MNVSVTSDPNESQATQLLNDLLENGTASNRKTSGRSPGLNTRSMHSNEISSDSFNSSRHSNTLPQYHFHGLASTQTQSQHCEEPEELNGGSQKENIGTNRPSKDVGGFHASPPPRQGSPHASSSKKVQDVVFHNDSRSSMSSGQRGSSNRKGPTVTVAFQSRTQKPSSSSAARSSPLKPMSHFAPRRLPSPSDSQDSFACDLDNKPDEQYLARSDKFALPLSELGKHSSAIRAPSNPTASSSYHKECSPPSGKILVEATPSHSGSSQHDEPLNLSQKLEETQLVDDHGDVIQRTKDTRTVDNDGNGSGYESSEPSSSYRRFLDGERGSEHQMQATQPSTQVDDSSAGPISEGAIPWSNLRSAPHPSASSAPHSLLSMVAPENRWRYRHYLQTGSGAQENGGIIPSTFGQTFGSCDRRTPSSFPVSPMDRSSGFSTTRDMRTRIRPPSPVQPDAMDVVPDSEPIAQEEMLPESKLPAVLPASQTSAKPVDPSKDLVTEETGMDVDPNSGVIHRREEEEEEEEEEEDEEEIPLAAKQVKNTIAAKRNFSTNMPPPGKMPSKEKVPAPLPRKKPISNPAKPEGGGKSWETIVPSSVPEQDHSSRGVKSEKLPLSKNKAQRAAPARTQTRRGSRPRPAASKPRSSKREPEVVSESEAEPRMQSTSRDGTEPVEDEFLANEDDVGSRKRKLAPPTERKTRGSSRRAKRNVSPAPRQSKRLRSALSTTSKINLEEATRVFALWRQDCHYYPGVVHSTSTDSLYLVKFDDDTESWVKLDQLRLLELRVGDDVLIANRFRPSRVVNIDGQDEGKVQVYVDEEVKVMQISSLRIASKTILYDWEDRMLTPQSIVTIIKPVKPHLSPSPSKLSMLSLPLVRGGTKKKVLARTGLIVTLTASNGNWEKEKETAMNAVKQSGGIVVDDLTTILRMDGRHLQNGNSWVITKTDVEWIGEQEIERLFLVADEPNQKPKFLMALALGIPCLNTEWLHESVKSGVEREWLGHLLPQGFSNVLHARPTQQVDIDWGNSHHHLTKIMANTVPSKLFAQKAILCVGRDMVPQLKGKRKNGSDEKSQLTGALPRIILAMGAETVEAVSESHLASREVTEYDYIVIRDSAQYSAEFAGCTTVHWAWVKECLVASRRLPLPVWPSLGEYSQEA